MALSAGLLISFALMPALGQTAVTLPQLVHSTRLAEMGEMAAGVAHELNQPLTGIKNFARNAAYMLDEGVGNVEEVKENLRLVSSQVDRASKIINQMRELARRTERHVPGGR